MDNVQKRGCNCGRKANFSDDHRLRIAKRDELYQRILAVHSRKSKIRPVDLSKVL